MEKTWETFWTTGKVTDYLAYRSSNSCGVQEEQKEQRNDGTVSSVDRYGSDSHAGGRL